MPEDFKDRELSVKFSASGESCGDKNACCEFVHQDYKYPGTEPGPWCRIFIAPLERNEQGELKRNWRCLKAERGE